MVAWTRATHVVELLQYVDVVIVVCVQYSIRCAKTSTLFLNLYESIKLPRIDHFVLITICLLLLKLALPTKLTSMGYSCYSQNIENP